MPVTLKSFDDKINDLKRKKKELELKQAQHLFKTASQIIGSAFSPQLAACIIEDSWNNSTSEKKEKWLKASEKFQVNKPRKAKPSAH